MSKYDAGMNDPSKWATPPDGLEPESFMEHENFGAPYRLPFDLCMELCNGDKRRARALYWGQYNKLKEQDDEAESSSR